jgi:hypothetical protein
MHAQSIARWHTTYVVMQKNLLLENFFGKIKKEQFERRIFKKKVNFRFFKNDFFSLIQILPVVYCGSGEISPTLKPNYGSCLESLPMFPFPWGVMGKIFEKTHYEAEILYDRCSTSHKV